jgi:hypothetical protein
MRNNSCLDLGATRQSANSQSESHSSRGTTPQPRTVRSSSFPFPFVPLQRRGCLVAPLFL